MCRPLSSWRAMTDSPMASRSLRILGVRSDSPPSSRRALQATLGLSWAHRESTRFIETGLYHQTFGGCTMRVSVAAIRRLVVAGMAAGAGDRARQGAGRHLLWSRASARHRGPSTTV
jgi:hypothetical protein